MAEWYQEKIGKFCQFNDWDSRNNLILEMQAKFATMSEPEREEVVKKLDLQPWFAQLTSVDKAETEQVCEALVVVSHAAEAGHIVRQYTSEICRLLDHQHAIVKRCLLEEVVAMATGTDTLPELLSQTDLLLKVAECVADRDLGVAQLAMEVLKKLGEIPEGIKLLYSGQLLRAFARLLTVNDNVKFRVFEVVAEVAVKSQAALEASVNSGFLHSLVQMFDTEDTLVQLNVLQILADLASTPGGLRFLEEQGMVQKLADAVAKANETPLSEFLIPGLMTFFGHFAKLYPQDVFSKYPVVVDALVKILDTEDQLILGVAIETFAHVASTVEGKYALEDVGHIANTAMKRIAEAIEKMSTQIRIRGLNALALILNVEKSEQDDKILSLVKRWFAALSDEPLKMLLSVCKQPFADIRKASLEVLAVIASQEWGQKSIANYPGLIEFLLDRSVESFKECKDVKFKVVKNLSRSVNVFDTETMEKLKRFVSDGAYHKDIVTEVAFEGA